ncbi:WXG100 family type VII secretion target [Actinoplanes sp. NPDC049599]|uniref:WXG100 family type VII secretion target n=1 Tax=Actinoplanes sp. NPDC049599 TaxID=3363903 RepID=UPI0037A8C2B1
MADNPLIAAPSAEGPGPWAGVWIAEDIELIIHGVRNGSWIDGTLGAVGAGLDGLALISDPAGALLQYGIAWLIDHVAPLSEALDWLAGDPAQIAAHAQTWRNMAGSLHDQADALGRSVRDDLEEWTGAAATAYHRHADHRARNLRTLGLAAEGMALMTEAAGALIGTVRIMVRDAIATVVARLIVYAGELLATAGLATPLVAEQVTTLCAAWGARIARWLKGLIASLRELGTAMRRLGDRVTALREGRAGSAEKGPDPVGASDARAADPDRPDATTRDLPPDPGGIPPGPPGPPWPVREGVPGPAKGKQLKPPNPRHTVAGARHGEVKPRNSVILRGNEAAVREDIRQIAAGNAEWNEKSARYEINGRSYDVHASGTVFPLSGRGIVELDRNEYAALQQLAKAGGNPADVPQFTRNPRFVNHPEAIEKAKAVYDGTYPG